MERNPQNTERPNPVPELSLSPIEVVEAHLRALQSTHKPWKNHGIMVRRAIHRFRQTRSHLRTDPRPPLLTRRTSARLQVAYEFCEGAAGMERSRYFGYSKDLYHFDHFLGEFQNAFPEMVENASYRVLSPDDGGGTSRPTVRVAVEGGDGAACEFTFVLVQRDFGGKKGCWMVESIVKHDSEI